MTTLVTLFGGGGFVGRYVTQALLRQGARVRVVERNPRDAFFLRTQGGLGQVHFAAADITKPASVARAVAGSDAVVNLVGLLKGDFQAVHVDGARHVADAAATAGAKALVQVSAIGADPASPSAYARTKGEGEAAVRAAFPGATIVRPSVVFGAEDDFLNKFARMIQLLPVVPVIAGATRFQPVWAADVGKAIATAALDPNTHAGRTFELGGPETLSMIELNRKIAGLIGRDRSFAEMSDGMASLLAKLPFAPLTSDQLTLLGRDNVVSPGAEGLAALGVTPTAIETVAPQWMVKFHKQGRFGAERQTI
jgi:NADH dehydrogenase